MFIPDYADPACPPIKVEVYTLSTDSRKVVINDIDYIS